jgi:hypothetical protein
MRKPLIHLIIFLLIGFGTKAMAVPMTFDLLGFNDANLSATVTFTYTPPAPSFAGRRLQINVQNTSDPLAGPDPRLTAFAFNLPENVLGLIPSRLPTPSLPLGWVPLLNRDGIDTPGQFGFFDFALVTGPRFEGGDPNDGIPRSSTFNFIFDVARLGLDALSENSFRDLLSFDPAGTPDEDEQFFIARFQRTGSLDMPGSDVAIPGTRAAPTPVPEPTTFLLVGSGLIGFAVLRRRKNSKRVVS